MTNWRKRARGLAAALALMAAATPALALDLPELMSLLARQRGGEARFTEQRFVRSLDEPLQASGTLSFAAPDRFTRRTLAPRAETMAVEGNLLTLTRNGRSRSVTLDSAPEMVALVEAMRGTLTGNAQTLERHFRATPGGSAEAWTLDLVPRESHVSASVRSVHIVGRGSDVRVVESCSSTATARSCRSSRWPAEALKCLPRDARPAGGAISVAHRAARDPRPMKRRAVQWIAKAPLRDGRPCPLRCCTALACACAATWRGRRPGHAFSGPRSRAAAPRADDTASTPLRHIATEATANGACARMPEPPARGGGGVPAGTPPAAPQGGGGACGRRPHSRSPGGVVCRPRC